MKNYNKGFTLTEVLIALVIMVVSSTILVGLYSTSMKFLGDQRKMTNESTKLRSAVESASAELRTGVTVSGNPANYKLSATPPTSGNKFTLSSIGVSVSGCAATFEASGEFTKDGSNLKYSKIASDFVGKTHAIFVSKYATPPDKPVIEKVYIAKNKRVYYLPFNADTDLVLSGKFLLKTGDKSKTQAIKYAWGSTLAYSTPSKYFNYLWTEESMGEQPLNGKPYSADVGFIETAIVEGTYNEGTSENNVPADFTVKSMTTATEIKDKQKYLNLLDSDVNLNVMPLGTSGYAGFGVDSISISQATQGKVRIIGLPYVKSLVNHNDANLIARSNPKSTHPKFWYSLFGTMFSNQVIKDYTDFQNKDNTKPIKWFDVREYFAGEFDTSATNNDKAPAFSGTGAFNFTTSFNGMPVNGNEGQSIVYSASTQFSATNKNQNETVFIKFKPEEGKDYCILSSNMNIASQVPTNNNQQAFMLYIEHKPDPSDATIKIPYIKFTYYDASGTKKDVEYDKNPFTQKFDKLDTDVNMPERDGYMTLAVAISTSSVRLAGLAPTIGGDNYNDMKTISTAIAISEPFFTKAKPGTTVNHTLTVGGIPKNSTNTENVAISNFLYYSENLFGIKTYTTGVDDVANYGALTMDYLFRKHLTDDERTMKDRSTTPTSFDEKYIAKYRP